jgi:hypothetical protein
MTTSRRSSSRHDIFDSNSPSESEKESQVEDDIDYTQNKELYFQSLDKLQKTVRKVVVKIIMMHKIIQNILIDTHSRK